MQFVVLTLPFWKGGDLKSVSQEAEGIGKEGMVAYPKRIQNWEGKGKEPGGAQEEMRGAPRNVRGGRTEKSLRFSMGMTKEEEVQK